MVIVNPQACGGKVARTWVQIEKLLAGLPFDMYVEHTQARGHATAICQHALRRGVSRVIAVGGDGTTHEVLAGFFDEQGINRFPHAALGMVSHGTGADFRRLLGAMDPVAQAQALYDAPIRPIDCGLVRFRERPDAPGSRGRALTRPFLNVASVGISGLVDRLVERSSHPFGTSWTYLHAAFKAIMSYRAQNVRICIDDQLPRDLDLMLLALGNGQYFGAGMWVCPQATINDGKLDVVLVPQMSRASLVGLLTKVFRGRHLRDPRVQTLRCRKVEILTTAPLWLDIDGEALGLVPASFEIAPLAIRLWAPIAQDSRALAKPDLHAGHEWPIGRTAARGLLAPFAG